MIFDHPYNADSALQDEGDFAVGLAARYCRFWRHLSRGVRGQNATRAVSLFCRRRAGGRDGRCGRTGHAGSPRRRALTVASGRDRAG